MREMMIDGKRIMVMGCPMAALYYKQAFGRSLIKDAAAVEPDEVAIMQITWAMAKAAAETPKTFPSFEVWLTGLESFDTSDPELLEPYQEEVGRGFFRHRYQALTAAADGSTEPGA